MHYYRRIMKVQQDEIGATGKDEKKGRFSKRNRIGLLMTLL
jgi:hypothetical protein